MLNRLKAKNLILRFFLAVACFYLINYVAFTSKFSFISSNPDKIEKAIIDFEGFDFRNGLNQTIIPNIVHLLFINKTEIKFYEFVNILSIFFHHKPDNIYIHCDDCSFKGKYFEILQKNKELWSIIRLLKITFKNKIFGIKPG